MLCRTGRCHVVCVCKTGGALAWQHHIMEARVLKKTGRVCVDECVRQDVA
jgi:hypothetical protein